MLPVCGLASSSDDPKTVLLGQMRLARSLLTVAQSIFGTRSDADQRERVVFFFFSSPLLSTSFFLFSFSLPVFFSFILVLLSYAWS